MSGGQAGVQRGKGEYRQVAHIRWSLHGKNGQKLGYAGGGVRDAMSQCSFQYVSFVLSGSAVSMPCIRSRCMVQQYTVISW